MNIDQLASQVGMTVRTVRFYAGRGLIPPPRREGRNGYYGPGHLARLELVRELQAHGFTLSAIEGYLEHIPADAPPTQVALHRTLLSPWMPDLPEKVTRSDLEKRSGRALSDDDLELLVALSVIEPTPTEDVFRLAPAYLAVGVQFLDSGLPAESALAAQRIITAHGQALARELTELFRTTVWPHLIALAQPPEAIAALVQMFKPLTIQAFVASYQSAVDEGKRETIRRRT